MPSPSLSSSSHSHTPSPHTQSLGNMAHCIPFVKFKKKLKIYIFLFKVWKSVECYFYIFSGFGRFHWIATSKCFHLTYISWRFHSLSFSLRKSPRWCGKLHTSYLLIQRMKSGSESGKWKPMAPSIYIPSFKSFSRREGATDAWRRPYVNPKP